MFSLISDDNLWPVAEPQWAALELVYQREWSVTQHMEESPPLLSELQ